MQDSAFDSPRMQAGWFEWLPVAVGAGILCYTMLPEEPVLWPALVLVPLLLVAGFIFRAHRPARLTTLYLIMITLGFVAAHWQTSRINAPMLKEPLFITKMQGEVTRITPAEHRLSVILNVRSIADMKDVSIMPTRVRMSLRGNHTALRVGDVIELRGKLFPPSPPLMPGGYDFSRHFFYRHIGGMGYVIPPYTIIERGAERSSYYALLGDLQQFRYELERWLLDSMPKPANGLIVAFTTGDTLALDKGAEAALRGSGLTHILSISGMHMAIVCGLFFFGLRFIMAAIPPLALRINIKKLSATLALLGGAAYLVLADFPVSAVRAYVMIFFFFLAVLLDRQAVTVRSLAWAALAILLFQPSSLVEAGFQLSFIATLALVVFYREVAMRWGGVWSEELRWWQRPALYIAGLITSSLIASFTTAPFVAAYFNVFNAYSILANLITLPLMSFLIMPALILALFLAPLGLGEPFLWLAAKGGEWMIALAAWVTAIPGANWYIPPISDWALICVAAGTLFLLLGPPRWRFWGLLPICLAMLTSLWFKQPDIIIEREMWHIALRDKDDQWWLWRGRSNRNFVVRYWQEKLGEEMKVWKFEDTLPGLKCYRQGCWWNAYGKTVVLPWKPEFLKHACRHADIVITRFRDEAKEYCPNVLRITQDELKNGGSVGVYMRGEKLEIRYSCGRQADRPWSGCYFN